jgi:hypothetical protein
LPVGRPKKAGRKLKERKEKYQDFRTEIGMLSQDFPQISKIYIPDFHMMMVNKYYIFPFFSSKMKWAIGELIDF